MNNNSNRDYATENINLKQQVIDLKVANKDKAETIKAMKQELLEYSQLRDRFKVLYEENQKLKKEYNLLDTTMESDDRIICELLKEKEQLEKDNKELKEWYNNLLNELKQMKMEQINKVDNLSAEESMKFIFNKGWNDAIDTISVKISLKLLSKILDKCEVNE